MMTSPELSQKTQNIFWQDHVVTREERERLNRHRGAVIWLTGLSGAGKSTIANLVEQRLHALEHRTYLLDGDNLRHGLNRDLGFGVQERQENVRRIAEVAKLMVDAGLITIVAVISPFASGRIQARSLFGSSDFFEVHVDASLDIVRARDPKGLYKKASEGIVSQLPGFDLPYESPSNPELYLDTGSCSPHQAATLILSTIFK